MKLKLFKKKETEHNYLELTPIRMKESEEREDGQFDILVPKFKSNIAKKIFEPRMKSPYFKANLDEFGTEAWKLIDGDKNVQVIGEQLLNKYGEKIEPVYDRLTEFLTNLHRYEFITFKELKKGNNNG